MNWTIREDVNLDLKVNILDISSAARAFLTKLGDLRWNAADDTNNDGQVNIVDLTAIAIKLGWVGSTPSHTTLIVSSTTSLYETGVEDQMKTVFQTKFPWITISFLSQGTGAAIQTAIRGDADMIMVHDPAQENTFLVNGYGVNRKIIASNFFIIVGPQDDPANITGMAPLDALKQIKTLGEQGKAKWISRGDGSGTNSKEKNLWKAAGINWTQIRTETSWYKETGQGMTATLLAANELGGYTLSDTASYLTNTNAGNIQMKIVVQANKDLLNVYSVIADNPLNANLTNTNFAASMLFIQYLVSDEGQNLLANYGTSTFGAPLFTPFVPLVSTGSNATLLSWIQNYAYIPSNATECPSAYRYDASRVYSNNWDTP
jgi:tungstate transport system substrate-binding protein